MQTWYIHMTWTGILSCMPLLKRHLLVRATSTWTASGGVPTKVLVRLGRMEGRMGGSVTPWVGNSAGCRLGKPPSWTYQPHVEMEWWGDGIVLYKAVRKPSSQPKHRFSSPCAYFRYDWSYIISRFDGLSQYYSPTLGVFFPHPISRTSQWLFQLLWIILNYSPFYTPLVHHNH